MIPKVFINDKIIRILTKEHSIIIDISEDKIYRDGKRIKTTRLKEHKFDSKFKKDKNLNKEHKPFFEFNEFPDNTLKANVGYDGRIFFHYFTKGSKQSFRAKAVWKSSYFNNRIMHQKEWYGNNLSIPDVLLFMSLIPLNIFVLCKSEITLKL